MTPWWTFNGLKKKLGRFQFLLLLIAIIFTAGYWGYELGAKLQSMLSAKVEEQDDRLAKLYQELDNKIRQINYISVELEVERRANVQIQEELLTLREELFSLRRELNFYQKVVAPELVADGISVEQFDVEETNIEGRYRFRFALVQTNNKKRYARGYIRLQLNAIKNEVKVNYDMAELAGLTKENLKFNFHYFQYFEGEFELESEVIAEALEVKVIQPKTKWQKYKAFTQVLEWPDSQQISLD
ncbi:MAG: hypothetical protein HWE10_10700 [Gammaproteobacteria bacterium]|nr:hypothetical protein [Gammaproteobacteria bacterium]